VAALRLARGLGDDAFEVQRAGGAVELETAVGEVVEEGKVRDRSFQQPAFCTTSLWSGFSSTMYCPHEKQ